MGQPHLTEAAGTLRVERGWTDADLAGGLGHVELIGLEALEMSAGVPWSLADLLVVGVCGRLGTVAAALDPEPDGSCPARDDHLTQPFELLRGIRGGRFDGVSWDAAVRDLGAHLGFQPVSGYGDALVLWLRQLVDGALVPLGLPEPAWVRLFDLPVQEVRQFAREALAEAKLRRAPAPAAGMAVEAVVTASLPAILIEVVVRTHVHWHTFVDTGSAQLSPAGRQKLEEMVRAAHALVAAAALSSAAADGAAGHEENDEGAGMRALIRDGLTAVEVVRARRARYGHGAEAWVGAEDLPWSSPDAPTLAARLDRIGR